jgi:hypothetical protein
MSFLPFDWLGEHSAHPLIECTDLSFHFIGWVNILPITLLAALIFLSISLAG